jgi:pyruvate dehydrogenase E2 component (dihydrolipoamide acetyltransferase)
MAEIIMPRLSDTMEEGTLSLWHKKVGDRVEKGEVLADIETDKAVMELEAYESGVLEQILVPAGDSAPIGQPIAVLGSGEGVAAGTDSIPSAASPADAAAPAPEIRTGPEPPVVQPAPAQGEGERVKASPVARAMARDHGLDLRAATGSGPGGRVVKADVEALLSGGAPVPAPVPPPTGDGGAAAAPAVARAGEDVEEVPLSTMRRITGRRLVESMQSAPHFYLTAVIDAEELLAFRAGLNAQLAEAGGPKVSVNDLIVKASAAALRANGAVNVSFAGDKLLRHERVHVGIAVALEGGLIVPVIRDADRKTLTQVSTEARALAEKARAGRLASDEFSGGTFTVSNLGMYGVDHFTAVINPPEAAILAVGATTPEPVVRDGTVVVRHTLKATLSIDHRALDGATAAVFLGQLKQLLEAPLRILA